MALSHCTGSLLRRQAIAKMLASSQCLETVMDVGVHHVGAAVDAFGVHHCPPERHHLPCSACIITALHVSKRQRQLSWVDKWGPDIADSVPQSLWAHSIGAMRPYHRPHPQLSPDLN